MLEQIKEKALAGEPASIDEALALDAQYSTDALCDAADEVRKKWCGNTVHTCSIVNARSGRCGEDCKWCAQSAHHKTGITEYEYIPHDEMMNALEANRRLGIKCFSLVTSGRKVNAAQIGYFCRLYKEANDKGGINLCASMGLLDREQLQQLYDAGVRKYHCNLESSPSFFPTLCTTHTYEDKLRTIRMAREIGFEICCGGIIGMGESLRDRLELAQQAREAGASSIPVNILQPIKGTPLENIELITEDEIIRSVALMRLVAPKCTLHFAGGRARLSREASARMLRGGINGALVGDMLTTIGNKVNEDYQLFNECGYTQVAVISPEEFQSRLTTDPQAYLLDVRKPAEFAEGHLAGANLINWLDIDTFKQKAAELDKTKTIYVYCRSGRRSNDAATYLASQGYKVVDMDGGILAWETQHLPIEH